MIAMTKRVLFILLLMGFAVLSESITQSFEANVHSFAIAPALSGLKLWTNPKPPVLMIDRDVVATHARVAPASPTTPCKPGEWAQDGLYLYVCVAEDWWRRAPLEAW